MIITIIIQLLHLTVIDICGCVYGPPHITELLPVMLILVLVLVLVCKDSLRTNFKSLSLSLSLWIWSLALSLSYSSCEVLIFAKNVHLYIVCLPLECNYVILYLSVF